MSNANDPSRERQDNLRPEPENQADRMTPPEEVIELGPPAESIASDVGPGTGGATQSDGRTRHHEGVHLGNQPNS
ncbi:MAG TPA: hypothetical protein VFI15_11130 [Candidatus Limnocylindrales bacterium]|nr:hypothetical protein [Candidatus Limnocylindrales bacterium]